ncbi:hypothetical protein BHE74_00024338 [Ensete ventricosum]|nr:hypothetical protein BHE74_00024338 [Ensete ventricosum]
MKITEKHDVYSFGVVNLEVLQGRHPGELISAWPSDAQSVLLKDLLDPRIPLPTLEESNAVMLAAKLALQCISINPQREEGRGKREEKEKRGSRLRHVLLHLCFLQRKQRMCSELGEKKGRRGEEEKGNERKTGLQL